VLFRCNNKSLDTIDRGINCIVNLIYHYKCVKNDDLDSVQSEGNIAQQLKSM
jgi:hypothetical protein